MSHPTVALHTYVGKLALEPFRFPGNLLHLLRYVHIHTAAGIEQDRYTVPKTKKIQTRNKAGNLGYYAIMLAGVSGGVLFVWCSAIDGVYEVYVLRTSSCLVSPAHMVFAAVEMSFRTDVVAQEYKYSCR